MAELLDPNDLVTIEEVARIDRWEVGGLVMRMLGKVSRLLHDGESSA